MSAGMRSVVVTGAGSGIGRATALRLAREGWFAVGVERDPASADALAQELGEGGASVVGDVADAAVLEQAAAVAGASAPLAGWVGCAGLCRHGTLLHELERADVRRLLAVNVEAIVHGAAIAVRAFLAGGGGAIVNVSSLLAARSSGTHPDYDASKAAVEALTRSAAVAYGQAGIRVNAVAPGAVRTAMLPGCDDDGPPPQARAAPLQRVGEPAEVAAAISFLLSDEASFVTGQVLAVDGGWSVALAVPSLGGGGA